MFFGITIFLTGFIVLYVALSKAYFATPAPPKPKSS